MMLFPQLQLAFRLMLVFLVWQLSHPSQVYQAILPSPSLSRRLTYPRWLPSQMCQACLASEQFPMCLALWSFLLWLSTSSMKQ